ncbi:MAG TPA: prenyltransferase [Spirochaetia bacterium]|nr:prenyltransferase [Spirochaetia bacterium]
MVAAELLTGFIRTSFSLAFDLRSYRAGWKALRAPSLVIAAASCALGIALAFQRGRGDWINAVAVMVCGLALQAGVNLVNDFFEFMQKKVDDKVENLRFSREDRITLEWLIFLVGVALFGFAGLVGLFIAWRTGWPVLILGVVGFLGGFFYTGEPLNYKRRGLAVPIVFFLMGVIMISGSYYAVSRVFSWDIVAISVPVSFLVSLILLTNELRDFEADTRFGIRTLTVRVGYRRAVGVYCILLLLAYGGPALLAIVGLFPRVLYLCFAVPFVIPPFLFMGRPARQRTMIVPAVMLHHLAYGTFFCLSYLAAARS